MHVIQTWFNLGTIGVSKRWGKKTNKTDFFLNYFSFKETSETEDNWLWSFKKYLVFQEKKKLLSVYQPDPRVK